MKALVCEICNSRNFVKQDGMYVCQQCGTKYTVEEAKKLMVDVTDTPAGTYNYAPVSNYGGGNIAGTNEPKKKSHKKAIITVSVIVGVLILLAVGTFVGLRVYDDYRKTEIINNASNEVFSNTWKSLDSDKTFKLEENGGSYGDYKITSWKFKAPVLNITYEVPGTTYKEPSPENITLNLTLDQDDIMVLTLEGKNERFVKESDYSKAKGVIK